MAVQRSAGMSRPLLYATRQFVLHGLPTTRMRTSFAALAASALPWPTKILPLMPSNSFRSIPCLRERTNQERPVAIVKRLICVIGNNDFLKCRKRAIVEFHDDALQRLHCLRNLQQLKDDLLIGAEHLTRSESAQHGVGHLPRRSSHRHSNCIRHGCFIGQLSVVSCQSSVVSCFDGCRAGRTLVHYQRIVRTAISHYPCRLSKTTDN